MPPLVYETVAWLRIYSPLPYPLLPGESESGIAAEAARNAHAAPIAGGLIGLAAGIVMVAAAALGAGDVVAAAAAVLALLVITGGRAEQTLAAMADRRSETAVVRYGIAAVALVVLLRTGALDGLLFYGAWDAAFALAGACAVSRAAAIAFTLLRPAEGAPAEPASLQWLGLAGLAIGIAAVLPFFGLGPALAGLAAAAGAVALVSAFLPRSSSDGDRGFLMIAELASEIAFLLAVLAFANNS
jgi:adenosylcobinamide-GDP ribazoletransferase